MSDLNTEPKSLSNTQNHILRRLLDTSLVLNSGQSIEPLLTYIMDVATEITHSEAASILLLDRHTHELHFVATNHPTTKQKMAHIPVPLDSSIAGAVVIHNRPIVILDAINDPRIHRAVDEAITFETRSLIGVPMRIKDHVIGTLEIVNWLDTPWTEEDLSHLNILASQAAVAIENAQQAEALRQAYEELNKLDRVKDNFIAIASHELRTPLSVIIGYATFLQEEAQGEAIEHATAVLDSAQHLGQIIENLVSVRYMRTGATDFQFSPTALAAPIAAAHHEVASLATAKGQRMTVHAPDTDLLVNVDAEKLEMALVNLFNNAVKFTPPGGMITVHTELHGAEVWTCITDTGLGIPTEDLESIFKDFYQVADHLTRDYNGIGMGLSVARAVIQHHGGRIWAESQGMGYGAKFTIALPIATEVQDEAIDS